MELRYAFENWNRNGRWFPKPIEITELCEAYRISLANQEFSIGCHRCEWTGYYEVRRKGVERFVAQCPCVKNPGLRENDSRYQQGYSGNDMMWLYDLYLKRKDSMPKRPMTDDEIDKLLDELDQHRGKSPAWRSM